MTIEEVFQIYGLKIQPYNDKKTLYDTSLNVIKSIVIFDEISLYLDKYFLIKNNGLYGLCDFLGNRILECKYAIIKHCNNDFFIVCDAYNYFGLIDSAGKSLISINYSNIEKIDESRLAVYNSSHKCALFSYSGSQLTDFDYISIEPWQETFYMVDRYTSEMGLINASGHQILPCIFDTIDICNGFFKVSTFKINDYGPNKKEVGLYNLNGKVIIPCKYKDIIVESDYFLAIEEHRTGIFPLSHYEDVYGVYSKLGRLIAPCKYHKIEFSTEHRIFTLSKNRPPQKDYINEDGKHCILVDGLYIPFSNIKYPELLQNNLIKAISMESGRYGLITVTGKTLIDFDYGDIFPISDRIYVCRSQYLKSASSTREKGYYTYDIIKLDINLNKSQMLYKDLDDFEKIIAYYYQKPDVVSSEIFNIKLNADGGYYRLMLNTGEIMTPYPIKVEPLIHRIDLIPFKSYEHRSPNFGKIGFFNVPKKYLVEPKYDDIRFNPYTNSMSFEFQWNRNSEWLQPNKKIVIAIVKINEKFGAINEFGELIISATHEQMKFIENGIYAEASNYAYVFSTEGTNIKRYLIDDDEFYRRACAAEAADREAARQYEADLKDELDDIINNGGDWILDN